MMGTSSADSRGHIYGCSTVVLIGFTCPHIVQSARNRNRNQWTAEVWHAGGRAGFYLFLEGGFYLFKFWGRSPPLLCSGQTLWGFLGQ